MKKRKYFKHKKLYLVAFLVLSLLFTSNGSNLNAVEVNANSVKDIIKLEDEKVISQRKFKGHDYQRAIKENGMNVEVIEANEKEIQKISKENIKAVANGASDDDLTPLATEVITVSEEEADDWIALTIIDGIFRTEKVKAGTKIYKSYYSYGKGYEMYKDSNGRVLFCVHWGTETPDNYKTKIVGWDKFYAKYKNTISVNKDRAEKIGALAIHYYKSEKKAAYIFSGQELIWGKNHPGSTSATKSKIKQRLDKWDTRPSFNNKTYSLKPGESKKVSDANKELVYFTNSNKKKSGTLSNGIKYSISDNTITFTNPKDNTKETQSDLKLDKYNGWFINDSGYGLFNNKGQQELATFGNPATAGALIKVKSDYELAYGSAELLKKYDGEDLYEQLMMIDEKPYYLTVDGNNVNVEGVTIDMLKFPSKQVMQNGNLYEQAVTYEYYDLKVKTHLVDKLDGDGNPVYELDLFGNRIPVIDEVTGEQKIDPVTSEPMWYIVQEEKNVLGDDGKLVYEAKLDGNGNPIMLTKTLPINYPIKDVMEAIEDADSDVTFGVYKEDKKTLVETITVSDGKAKTGSLLVGKYFIKELTTKDGFTLDTKWREVVIEKNKVTQINAGKVIYNYTMLGGLEIIKIDEDTKEPIENVRLNIYEAQDGKCLEENYTDENLLYSGFSDENGQVEYVTSKDREVCVVERDTINGYLLESSKDIDPVQIKVNETNTIHVVNKMLAINLNIKKVGESDDVLPGTIFDLIASDVEGNEVYNFKGLKINEEGYINIKFNAMQPAFDKNGNSYAFELIETKALDGYKKLAPMTFWLALDEDGKAVVSKDEYTFAKNLNAEQELDVEMLVKNDLKKVKIILEKLATENKKRLAGAEFNVDVYDRDNVLVDTQIAKSKANFATELEFSILNTSKVCIYETKAPKNRILDKTKQCQEINIEDEDGHVFETMKFYNELKVVAQAGGIQFNANVFKNVNKIYDFNVLN